ncbi:MAG: hypothetical protein IJ860_05695 [Eubacterium sp.]|nr:hypothetical protein [Eubacterium sp.]
MKWWIVLIIIVAVAAAVIAILTIIGKRAQKKQEAQREQIEAAKQAVNMLVIDKKKLRLKDAGLPQVVLDNTSKMMQRSKVPVVKAKVGPRVATFLTDNDVYDVIPVKKEVKAEISGLYIVSVKGIRGPLVSEKAEKKRKKKDSFLERALRKGRGEA